MFGSSRKNRLLLVGDIVFPMESPVPRRRAPGRAEPGDDVLKELRCDWECEMEDLRPTVPTAELLSFDTP